MSPTCLRNSTFVDLLIIVQTSLIIEDLGGNSKSLFVRLCFHVAKLWEALNLPALAVIHTSECI